MWCLYSVNLCNGALKIPYEKEIQKKKQQQQQANKQRNETKKEKREFKVKLSFFAFAEKRLQNLCDGRFLGCSSSLTLIKCAAFCWTNRRIIDEAIRNN